MRVFSITSSYPRYEGDPTAPFIESITRHVAARGHEVHLVLPENREWRRASSEGDVHFYPYRYSPRRAWTPWGYSESLEGGIRIRRSLYALAPVVFASAARTCAKVLSRSPFDLVHVHWVIPNGPIGTIAARRHRLPLVLSLHGSDVSVAQRSHRMGRVARACFARAAAVTAPSADLLERARSLGARGHLEVIPYGADVEAFSVDATATQRVRAELGVGADTTIVCGVGRFVHWKGFDYLIAAFAKARSEHRDLRLVLVGDGDLRGDLEARVRSLGLWDAVTFAGMAARSEMPGYLAAADVVVVPSIQYDGYVDGLPNVALEAMASGTPVVATRVGGLPELVRSGENGVLVDEKDVEQLAAAITALARNRDLRTRLGQAGRAEILHERRWEAVADRFVDVFERVVKRQAT